MDRESATLEAGLLASSRGGLAPGRGSGVGAKRALDELAGDHDEVTAHARVGVRQDECAALVARRPDDLALGPKPEVGIAPDHGPHVRRIDASRGVSAIQEEPDLFDREADLLER